MFPLGSAEMMTETNEMMAKIAESIKKLPNKIAIVGHTDATPYRAGSGYSNWELSTDRAHATRRALIAAGVPEERLVTVTGKAATDPLNKADPEAPSNRRISILLLRETMPPKPLRRGFSDTQSSPFGNYQAPISPSQTVPVVPPRVEQAGGSAFEDRDLDPFESTSPESDADNDADEVVPAPAQTPTESAKAKESKAEAEAFPAEEITPPQEEELIDSDLWQRL
ncbi:MAG: OmpA family protein [Proteobacteria bacterium]|nr:OmpA family protein [Pseudomonadota bacterium]MDA1355505.1 OmpA family protein [Pseudomonadota bacterium]